MMCIPDMLQYISTMISLLFLSSLVN